MRRAVREWLERERVLLEHVCAVKRRKLFQKDGWGVVNLDVCYDCLIGARNDCTLGVSVRIARYAESVEQAVGTRVVVVVVLVEQMFGRWG